jgi:hypothetical protein
MVTKDIVKVHTTISEMQQRI